MNPMVSQSPTGNGKLLIVGPRHLVGAFTEIIPRSFPFDATDDVAEARVRLIGRAPEAIVVLTETGGPDMLAKVQVLASGGEAPLLLVVPGLTPNDELTALRLGVAECL